MGNVYVQTHKKDPEIYVYSVYFIQDLNLAERGHLKENIKVIDKYYMYQRDVLISLFQ